MEGTLPSGTLPLSTLDKGYPLSYSLIPLGFRLKPYPTQKQSLATGWCIRTFFWSIFQTFWKVYCCPDFLFLKVETSNFGYLLIFWFPLTVQSFSKIGQHWHQTFYKGPPFEFLVNCKIKKHQRGDHYKMSIINVVQSYWNFAQLKEIKK